MHVVPATCEIGGNQEHLTVVVIFNDWNVDGNPAAAERSSLLKYVDSNPEHVSIWMIIEHFDY